MLRPGQRLRMNGSQHQPLDRVMPAVDFVGIVGEADRLDDRALLQALPSAFDLEVLDERDGVAVGQHLAGGIAHFDASGSSCNRSHLRRWSPFPCRVVIDVVVVLICHCRG